MSNNIPLPGTQLSIESIEQGSGSGIERQVTQALPYTAGALTGFGGVLSSGTATIAAPANPIKFWYIQNQDVAPLVVQFGISGPTFVLAAADQTGGSGGWISSTQLGIIWDGSIILTSLKTNSQFDGAFGFSP